MSQTITPVEEPLPYQVIVTTLAHPEEKKVNYSADLDPKKKVKPYEAKTLSKDLFFDLKVLGALLLAPVHLKLYVAGSLIGLAKPIYDWRANQIVQKKINGDFRDKSFGKMSTEAKLTYAALCIIGPAIVAIATESKLPLISKGIVFFGGFTCWQEISQRAVRWWNNP